MIDATQNAARGTVAATTSHARRGRNVEAGDTRWGAAALILFSTPIGDAPAWYRVARLFD